MAAKNAQGSRKAAPKKRKRPPLDSAARFEQILKRARNLENFSLCLYITGTTPRSTEAIANVRTLCEEYLPGRYELKVVDIYQQPQMAAGDQIIAAPTLIKSLPAPPRRIIGNLSSRDRVLVGLNLKPKRPDQAAKALHWVEL
jgi:circadian clock protein KaiB